MIIDNRVLCTGYAEIWHNKSDEGSGLDFCSHSHSQCEILYVFQGEVEFYVEGYRYPLLPASMLLTPPYNFHGWVPRSRRIYHRVSVLFAPELLDQTEQGLFLKMFRSGPRFFPNTSSKDICFFIRAILECGDMEEPLRKTALKSRLVSLLSEIPFLEENRTLVPVSADQRVFGVLEYLDKHLREKLPLEDLARRFNISKNYLNILFRKATGTTVNHYIRIKRLGFARQEIQRGTHAEEAAYNAGFKDYSNFFKAYKSFYGSAPSVQRPGGCQHLRSPPEPQSTCEEQAPLDPGSRVRRAEDSPEHISRYAGPGFARP
ncbi:MAG: AraC family transcriptional regulator [Treponema sp.]|jgi:AraC-like DNA-binding protein|nr:AraC family transcriptional regulator [Treponema sp.]